MAEDSFIETYFNYASPLTDAPSDFHHFTALTIMASAIGKRVYIPFGASRIYPNLWTVLIAPSSFYRKTTAIGIGRKILHQACPDALFPNEFTPEALMDSLEKNPTGLFIWSEFGGALANFERSYMVGTKELFTDLYDSPPEYKRLLKGKEYSIKDPCLNILTASTGEWFSSRIKEGDVKGGFLARFLYIPAYKKTKRIGIPPEPNAELGRQLTFILQQYRKLNGKADISKIKSLYDSWLFELEDSLHGEAKQEILSGFYTRLSIYTLKIALLYQISMDGEIAISPNSLGRAISLTEGLKQNIKNILSEELIFTKEMKDQKTVLQIIIKNPGIEHGLLLRNSHLSAKQLKEVKETLIQQGSIKLTGNRHYPINHSSQSSQKLAEDEANSSQSSQSVRIGVANV